MIADISTDTQSPFEVRRDDFLYGFNGCTGNHPNPTLGKKSLCPPPQASSDHEVGLPTGVEVPGSDGARLGPRKEGGGAFKLQASEASQDEQPNSGRVSEGQVGPRVSVQVRRNDRHGRRVHEDEPGGLEGSASGPSQQGDRAGDFIRRDDVDDAVAIEIDGGDVRRASSDGSRLERAELPGAAEPPAVPDGSPPQLSVVPKPD